MPACPPTSTEDIVRRLLERRTDPLVGWPPRARSDLLALLHRADEELTRLPEAVQRVVHCRFTERRSEASTARHLDLPRESVRQSLSHAIICLARALGLASDTPTQNRRSFP